MLKSSNGVVLIIVAHPDDEAIFFFGLIGELVNQGRDVRVICATGEFDNPALTATRLGEFEESCRRLGVECASLGLLDRRRRLLCPRSISERLRVLVGDCRVLAVYTHNPWGDYGHPHHAAVCAAVYELFPNETRSLSGPFPPEERIELPEAEFQRKVAHAREVYKSQPFATSWVSRVESFSRLRGDYVCSLARYLCPLGAGMSMTAWRLDSLTDGEILRVVQQLVRGFSAETEIAAELQSIPYRVWSKPLARFWRRLTVLSDDKSTSFALPIRELRSPQE